MSCYCLACGEGGLVPSLDLGLQPLANSFKKDPNDEEDLYPLAVVLCRACYHLQLNYFIDPDLMFKNYLYVSGTSTTYREYLRNFARTVATPRMKVLDIGCNDGTQLDMFKEVGCETWGIDPAENLYKISSKNHKVTLGYFDSSYRPGIEFDIINAQNVFAHNRDPTTFLINCKNILKNDGKVYIQTSQADMIRNGEFDTIYHEHINFFNIFSFKKLTERSGLVLYDVQKTDIHGVSYMFVLSKTGPATANVSSMIEEERSSGLYNLSTYSEWEQSCLNFKKNIVEKLSGKTVVAYGAAAKGNTLLNFIKVSPIVIVDDNPLKQGMFSPGMNVPIVPSTWISSAPHDEPLTFVPLAWNFFEEIKNRIISIRNNKLDGFVLLKFY